MDAEVFYELLQHWFRTNPTLRDRWHFISRVEFGTFKRECTRIHKLQWRRRLKKCVAAKALHAIVPLHFLGDTHELNVP